MIHERRIVVAPLDFGDRPVHVAVAKFGAALQRGSYLLQERIPVDNTQGTGGAENGVELVVRKPDRNHAAVTYARKWFTATAPRPRAPPRRAPETETARL